MRKTRLALSATIVMLAGCSTVPEPLRGTYTDITPQATSSRDIGRSVRWGGVILDARPDARQTCFEVLSRDLDSSMRPRNEDVTQGRFIACRDGFLDPEVFAKGREITLIGDLQALDERKVGDFDYRYPILATGFITMWPERPDVVVNNYFDPFWGPGPFWGPYWGPFWGHGYGFRRGFYGAGFGPRTTVRSGGSSKRVDVPVGSSPTQD